MLTVSAAPLVGPWRWVAVVLSAAVTVLGGGAVTTCVLGLASAAATTTARVQRDVLRGGAWIGALERLALLGTIPTRETPQKSVGRNDPCPCGSGKKFKKCCLH